MQTTLPLVSDILAVQLEFCQLFIFLDKLPHAWSAGLQLGLAEELVAQLLERRRVASSSSDAA